MDANRLIDSYKQRLDMALIHHLGAEGDHLSARIQAVAAEIPEDLAMLLKELDRIDGAAVSAAAAGESLADFAFRCGGAVERIASYARARAADDLIYTGADGRTVADPAVADLDALSRFRVARDRFLRQAADFSLKALVVLVVLLMLGFLLGLI